MRSFRRLLHGKEIGVAKKNKKQSGRIWLNGDQAMQGHLIWYVDTQYDIDAHVTVADCSRTVSLDFDCGKPAENRKKLKKLDRIIAELTKFRAALVEAQGQ